MKSILNFGLKLAVILIGVFLFHLFLLNTFALPLFAHYLVQAYVLNYFLAFGIYLFIYNFKEVLKYQIGFIFIGGSFIKFFLFFVFFYPHYKADGVILKSEFAAFFVPYLICLVAETLKIIKVLEALEYKKTKP